MISDTPSSTRRQVLKAAVAVACCAGAKIGTADAAVPTTVDQITDPTSTAARNMFRFEPDFVKLQPGDELVFLNSRSHHTVHSVPELWPDGVPAVSIAHQPEASVRFDREGYYGFRCQRHGQYGMVMLVVVGRPSGADKVRKVINIMKAKKRERAGFTRLLDQHDHS